jgi:hypothetical protein
MPRTVPLASTLLEAAAKYLENELMPRLSGYHRFNTRVTINVLNIVRRELDLREAQESGERARLVVLLGHDGSLEHLRDELCELIRSGRIDLNEPALRAYVKQSLADRLAINNPKWLVETK